MSSAYGIIQSPHMGTTVPPFTGLLKDGTGAIISLVTKETILSNELKILHSIFSDILIEGNTYPQNNESITLEDFSSYFLSHAAFICKSTITDEIYGAFYIKPNFPGRCSHICNGGFIVDFQHSNKGVGTLMGQSYLNLAPKLGYEASMFNLVFISNIASVKIWDNLGFQRLGILPGAGKLKGYSDPVDAIIFYLKFNDIQEKIA
jgi:GNAT superfamily N-acetyltransferase